MKYKHIVFDIDGTLIDTEYAVLHSLQETIRVLSGREIPCSELKFALGITGIAVCFFIVFSIISYFLLREFAYLSQRKSDKLKWICGRANYGF